MSQSYYKKHPVQLSLVLACGLGILWYIIYKASTTSFTHDESFTYTRYVHQCFMDIISYKTPYTNNHILNTVFMKYCEVFFGSSELSLRLPNILAFVVYSIFSTLLFCKYAPKLILPFYLLMVLNPYLLDFFALARGYGLSIGFLVMSIYYLCSYFTSKQNKHLILFNVGAFLAVMSNFSLLNYYVAALIIYNLVYYLNSKLDPSHHPYHVYKQNKINIISVIISGMFLYEPLRRVGKMNLLDFGGKNGFIEDTISTVIYGLFYDIYVSNFYLIILKTLVLFVVGIIATIIIKNIIQKQIDFLKSNAHLILINCILFAIVFITILQHIILGNDYYVHRFALFLYPLFILNFVFLLGYIYNSALKKIAISASYLFSVLIILNMYLNQNVVSYKDWEYDKDVKFVMQLLVLEHKKNPDKKITVGINWLFEPSTNFYRYTWDLKWLYPTHRKGIGKYDDYYYILTSDEDYLELMDKPLLFANEESEVVLFKNEY